MTTLPKYSSNLPITARKKAVPGIKPVEPPIVSQPKVELPKEELKPDVIDYSVELPKQSWETTPITNKESFGCCGYHTYCTKTGDCVKKTLHIHYAVTCALYKRLFAKGGR